MTHQLEGQVNAVFGAHRVGIAKATKKPYNFIEVSDGFKAVIFNTNLAEEDTKHLQRLDSVVLTMKCEPFRNQYEILEIVAD